VALFFLQNVFNQQVYQDTSYILAQPEIDEIEHRGVATKKLARITGKRFDSVRKFRAALRTQMAPTEQEESTILEVARIDPILINNSKLWLLDAQPLSDEQRAAMWKLVGRKFTHRWVLDSALAEASDAWKSRPATKKNKLFNRQLQRHRQVIYDTFRVAESPE
jgi:PiT family inorganic phosphate transporter